MRALTCTLFLILFAATTAFAQAAPKSGNLPALDTRKLVEEWIRRLNALDDWFISMDGKEETADVVNSMVELYAPDALQFVGPAEDQIGPVMLTGRETIRKWFEDFARRYIQLTYRIDVQTGGREQTTSLIYTTPMPWGGIAASCQITALYGLRQDRRRFMAPGGLFIQFREDGKIQRLRLLIQKDETFEIFR